MRRLDRRIFAAASLLTTLLLTSCDWDSGSQNNFNTSGGSANVNISGVYRGIEGGRAVENTSSGNITFLTIQQSGNRVAVTDNQGSRYEGTIGTPLVFEPPGGGTIPEGATVASYQIGFAGRDGVAARDVEFTGVITIVGVTDLVAETVDRVVVSPSGSTTTTRTETYAFERNNSQLELNGTWVEIGGVTSGVNAHGPAAQGNIRYDFDFVVGTGPDPRLPEAEAGGAGGP